MKLGSPLSQFSRWHYVIDDLVYLESMTVKISTLQIRTSIKSQNSIAMNSDVLTFNHRLYLEWYTSYISNWTKFNGDNSQITEWKRQQIPTISSLFKGEKKLILCFIPKFIKFLLKFGAQIVQVSFQFLFYNVKNNAMNFMHRLFKFHSKSQIYFKARSVWCLQIYSF